LRTEWLNKHVEPSTLCGPIKGFFEEKGLKTKETLSGDRHRVEAFFSYSPPVPFVVVEIHGDPERIVVDFLPWGKNERTAWTMLRSSVLTLFGGGVLVQKDLRNKELMQQVENQFWGFLDRYLLEQTG
jgi:hypothetical protein